eukprot:TRINITY_DN14416_c0_g1_i3.p2 TRINITY_DN14416_c0_g1~~TRINITY_DN14416_c0_g1_i3.p2  ORF type:complete len:102 (+),score=22.66 TRINITY_DN14416_c0_g1_i3:91-396(+)
MGNTPGGLPPGAGQGQGQGQGKGDGKGDKDKKEKKDPVSAPSHFGRKKKKHKGASAAARLPNVTPSTKCRCGGHAEGEALQRIHGQRRKLESLHGPCFATR